MKKIILTFILSITTTVIFAQKKHTFKLGVVGLLKKVTGWVEYTDNELKIHYDNPINDISFPVTKKNRQRE